VSDNPADVRGDLEPSQVRLRFAPSPTGSLHIGNVRTALFNWAFARHYGGTLVLRIEDTDVARNTEAGLESVLSSLHWLGLDYDEGPVVGGPFTPYLQSERMDYYRDVTKRLRGSGHAYDCYCSQVELDERREQARKEARSSGYDGHCRALTQQQVDAYVSEGRRPVLRMRMPDTAIAFDDLVRGEIVFGPTDIRSTPWSTPPTMRPWRSRMCFAGRTCCPRLHARSPCTTRSRIWG
jgi:glutamyl-tRNA synthetase